MKILLAIDGSTFSDAAVNEVAKKPWPADSEVKIISVVEPPLLPTVETWVPPDNYIEALEAAGEDQARSIVSKAADRVREGQVTTFVCLLRLSGSSEARDHRGSGLVGGRSDLDGLARLSWLDEAVARLGFSSRCLACEVFSGNCSRTRTAGRVKRYA
jgi:hypothetical protein